MTIHPYIRIERQAPSLEDQRVVLGLEPGQRAIVDTEPPSALNLLIGSLVPGDIVIVSEPSLLGDGVGDVRAAVRRILEAGASVESVSPPVRLAPEASLAVLDFMAAATEGMRRMRRTGTGRKPGRKGVADHLLEDARRDWLDTSLTKEEVARRYGVTWRTLYRQFGQRNPDP